MNHPVAPVRPSDPTEVGPFRIQGRLGSGGMGVVYLGAAADGSQAAVKVVHAALAEQPDFRARLAREVDAVSRIRSPFVASLVAADTESAYQWIATQYIQGPTLAERVAAGGALPDEELLEVLQGLALALQDVHRAGIAHRDIKPSNVIMSQSGPRLIDFGIAQALDATALTRTGASLGTAVWMSPEQISGLSTSPATDVFAWGLVAAWAATGHHPYGTGRPEVVAVRIAGAAPVLVGVPDWLIGLVRATLDTDPSARPTATELLGMLRAAGVARQPATGLGVAGAATVAGGDAPTLLDPEPRGGGPGSGLSTGPAGAAQRAHDRAPGSATAPAPRPDRARSGARLRLAAGAVLLAGATLGALAWSPWSTDVQPPPDPGTTASAPATSDTGSAGGPADAGTTSTTPAEEPAETPTPTVTVTATVEPTDPSEPADAPSTAPPSQEETPSDQDVVPLPPDES